MIVMHRRRFDAYTLAENVWLAGVEMRLREHADRIGVPFTVRHLPEDDEIDQWQIRS